MRFITFFLCLLVSTIGVKAQQFDTLYQEFDPRNHNANDKRYIQMSLAFLGTYESLIDGQWGRGSQGALEKYMKLPKGATITNRDVAEIVDTYHNEYGAEGWDYVNDASTGLSFLAPKPSFLKKSESNGYRTWAHVSRPLDYFLVRADQARTANFHQAILNRTGAQDKPYTVRKERRWVTSVNQADGNSTYARSEFLESQWSTVIVSTRDGQIDNAFKAVAGSIRTGRAQPLSLDGLSGLGNLLTLNRAFKGQGGSQQNQDTGIGSILDGNRSSDGNATVSGAGIVVNSKGIVLTSITNVQGCVQVKVAGRPAEIIAQNKQFDLVALKTGLKPGDGGWARFSLRPIKPESSFAVAGYEPREFWADMMIERGRIGSNIGNSLSMGLSGNLSTGYSGGPILDRDGGVVGLIVADAPPNARNGNVAIKAVHGEIAKLFLAQSGIGYAFMNNKTKIAENTFTASVQRFTMPVECLSN